MISSAQFHVTEYEGPQLGAPEEIRPVYKSQPMCLRDASRFAAALSHARSTYVQVVPDATDESYHEWWYTGWLWKRSQVPPISGGGL